MFYSKTAFFFVLASLFFLGIAATLLQNGNYGVTTPNEISLSELKANGPGNNAFIRLTEPCVAGEPVYADERGGNCFYIPLFRNHADAKGDTPIAAVVKISSINLQALRQAETYLANPTSRVEGLCRQTLAENPDQLFIENKYARPAGQAHVILFDSAPSMQTFLTGVGVIFFVFLTFVIGTLKECCAENQPATQSARISMVVVGLATTVISTLLLLQKFDAFFTTVILMFLGFGIARLVTGMLAIVLKEDLFTLNWFRSNNLSCDDSVFYVKSGMKKVEAPFQAIESVSFLRIQEDEAPANKIRFEIRGIIASQPFFVSGLATPSQYNRYLEEMSKLQAVLRDRLWNDLQNGTKISGEGWTLNTNELRFHQPKQPDTVIMLDTFDTVKEIDGEYRFWIRGNDLHVASLPVGNQNAQILTHAMLRLKEQMEVETDPNSRPRKLPATESTSKLGRVTFTETIKPNRWGMVFTILPFGIFLLYAGFWIMGLMLVAAGISALIGGSICNATSFRVHERGVSLKEGDDLTELAFDEMDEVTSKVEKHMNGTIHNGNTYKLTFRQNETEGQPPLSIAFESPKTFSKHYANAVHDASEMVSLKMAAELNDNDAIDWGPGCKLFKDGFSAPYGSLVRGKRRKVEFARVTGMKFDNARLLIYIDNKKMAKFNLDASQANFMPGFLLFKELVELATMKKNTQPNESAKHLITNR